MTTYREVCERLINADRKIHKLYSNTSVCWGGMGGSMMTWHCAMGCDNPVHNADRVEYNAAVAAYLMLVDMEKE